MRKYLTASLAFFSFFAYGQPGSEPVNVTDMLKIQSLWGITLSRDGKQAAFTVTKIEPDAESKGDYKYVNHIYVIAADGSTSPKEMTVKEGSSQPAWSPDGKQLAFVRLADGKPQVFIMSMDGGEPV
ncbi:MAG TPA: hypothetical protein VIM64_07880, partial [Puia sp.]